MRGEGVGKEGRVGNFKREAKDRLPEELRKTNILLNDDVYCSMCED